MAASLDPEDDYLTQYYNNSASAAGASAVAVVPPGTTADIDFHMIVDPKPTATPAVTLGVMLEMPADTFRYKDLFYLNARVCNPGQSMSGIPLFCHSGYRGRIVFLAELEEHRGRDRLSIDRFRQWCPDTTGFAGVRVAENQGDDDGSVFLWRYDTTGFQPASWRSGFRGIRIYRSIDRLRGYTIGPHYPHFLLSLPVRYYQARSDCGLRKTQNEDIFQLKCKISHEQGDTIVNANRIDNVRYRILPACLAFAALVISFPPVYRYVFFLDKDHGTFDQNGLHIIFCAVLGSIGLILASNRFLRLLLIPFLLVCGYYSAELKVFNFSVLFWGIVTFWLAQNLKFEERNFRLLFFTISGMLFLGDCFLINMDNVFRGRYVYSGSGPLFGYHPDFGWQQRPNARVQVTKMFKDEIVYENIEYVTDGDARRVCSRSPSNAPFHALFCGGSFTWGEGVPVDDTLACRVQDESGGRLCSYNLAVNGSGTSHMYIKLAKPEYLKGIEQKAGVCIYSFISDHGSRNVGHPFRTLTDAGLYPLFRINESGKLDGPFHYYQDPYLEAFFKFKRLFFHLSPAYRTRYRYKHDNPFPVETVAEVTAQLINYSKYAYQTRYKGEFFVVFWPQQPSDTWVELCDLLKGKLDVLKVRYINVPRMENPADGVLHPMDVHPNVVGNDWVFQHIWPEIRDYVELLWLYHRP